MICDRVNDNWEVECVKSLVLYVYWMYIGRHLFKRLFDPKEKQLFHDIQRYYALLTEGGGFSSHKFVHSVWTPVVLMCLRYTLHARCCCCRFARER